MRYLNQVVLECDKIKQMLGYYQCREHSKMTLRLRIEPDIEIGQTTELLSVRW